MSTVNIKPPSGAAVPATDEQLADLRKQIALLQAQTAALAEGMVAIKRDVEQGQVPLDLDGLPMSVANFENPTGPSLGDTMGSAMAAIEQMARYVAQVNANQVLVNMTGNTMTLGLPQDIGLLSTPQFKGAKIGVPEGIGNPPVVTAIAAGLGTGGTIDNVFGTDWCFRVDFTTGSDQAGASDIFSIVPANDYGTLPPLLLVIPANRQSSQRQSTASNAVAINLTNTTANSWKLQAGTTALAAATSYSYFFIAIKRHATT